MSSVTGVTASVQITHTATLPYFTVLPCNEFSEEPTSLDSRLSLAEKILTPPAASYKYWNLDLIIQESVVLRRESSGRESKYFSMVDSSSVKICSSKQKKALTLYAEELLSVSIKRYKKYAIEANGHRTMQDGEPECKSAWMVPPAFCVDQRSEKG